MFFDKAIKPIKESGQQPLEQDWLGDMTIGTTQSGAMKLSAVNACVEVITNSISKLPIFIMDSNTKERKSTTNSLRF